MLGTFSWFGEIGVRIFQHGILIAVSKLFFLANIAFTLAIICFLRALACILIGCAMCHEFASHWSSRVVVTIEDRRPSRNSLFLSEPE